MNSIQEVLQRTTTITFDCYGTLIDWRAGIESSLRDVFGDAVAPRLSEVFDAYVETEARIEAERYRTYREVLAEVVERLARRFALPVPPSRIQRLSELLPRWEPFPDTNEALTRLKKRYRLGVLSNIDRDLFAQTAARFDVAFDFVITAEDVRSYKPAPGHFERLLAFHARPEDVLHVAQSLYHDGGPCGKLGLAYAWINRYKQPGVAGVHPLAEYPDLGALAAESAV